MRVFLPLPVQKALDALVKAGYEAYLVGGCVRDALRGIKPHDYDVTTSALPEETLAVFSGYRTIATGIRHGTVTVLMDGMPIEITTYRVDGSYADHRRPDEVHFTSSLIEDLARRDFTVNAMAYHPDPGLVDPFGGSADLAAGIIRAVGDPMERFEEDALRILRALRFSARFGFRIEEKTHDAIFALADTLKLIAVERVREELVGILVAEYAEHILCEYADALSAVVPQGRLTDAFSRLPKEDHVLRLADFLSDAADGARRVLSALRFDNKTTQEVCGVLALYTSDIRPERECICRLLRASGAELLRKGILLRRAHGIDDSEALSLMEELLSKGFPYTIGMLDVSGEDLAVLGVPRGPRIGALLEALYTAVIRGEIENKKASLLAHAEHYI